MNWYLNPTTGVDSPELGRFEGSPLRTLAYLVYGGIGLVSGDTIYCAAGDYAENRAIVLTRYSNLRILGAGSAVTALIVDRARQTDRGTYGVVDAEGFVLGDGGFATPGRADSCEISGFTVIAAGVAASAVRIGWGSSNVLRDLRISRGSGGSGASLYVGDDSFGPQCHHNRILDCEVFDSGLRDLIVQEAPSTTILRTIFRGGPQVSYIVGQDRNLGMNGGAVIGSVFINQGLLIEDTGYWQVLHNTFLGCPVGLTVLAMFTGPPPSGADPLVAGSGPYVVQNNLFYSQGSGHVGLHFDGTQGNRTNITSDGNCFWLPSGIVGRVTNRDAGGNVVGSPADFATLAAVGDNDWQGKNTPGDADDTDLTSIQTDPLLLAQLPNDWHLDHASPCIDAGVSVSRPPDDLVDLDGNPRPHGDGLDIGADEIGVRTWLVGYPLKPDGPYDFSSIQACHDDPAVQPGDTVRVSQHNLADDGVYLEQLDLHKALRISVEEDEEITIRCPTRLGDPAGVVVSYRGDLHPMDLSSLDGDPKGVGDRRITIESGVRGVDVAGGSPQLRGLLIQSNNATSPHPSRYLLPLSVEAVGPGQWNLVDRLGRYVWPMGLNVFLARDYHNVYVHDDELGRLTPAEILLAVSGGYLSAADGTKIAAALPQLKDTELDGWLDVAAPDGYGGDRGLWVSELATPLASAGFTLFNYASDGEFRSTLQGIPVVVGKSASGGDSGASSENLLWAYQPNSGVNLVPFGGEGTGSWEDAFWLLLRNYAASYRNLNVMGVSISNELFWNWVGGGWRLPFFPNYAEAEAAWQTFSARAAALIRRAFPRALVFSNRFAGSIWGGGLAGDLTGLTGVVPPQYYKYAGQTYDWSDWDNSQPVDFANPPNGPYRIALVHAQAATPDVWCINNYRNSELGGPGGNNWQVTPTQVTGMSTAVGIPCWISEASFHAPLWYRQAHDANPADFLPNWVPDTDWNFVGVADEAAWITAINHELETWVELGAVVGFTYFSAFDHVMTPWGLFDPSLPRGSQEHPGRLAAVRAQRNLSLANRSAAVLGGAQILDTPGGAAADLLSAQVGDGGGIWVHGPVEDPAFRNVAVLANQAWNGGGLAVTDLGPDAFQGGSGFGEFRDLQLDGNAAVLVGGAGGDGGGAYLEDLDATSQKHTVFVALEVVNNTAEGDGGGMWIGGVGVTRFTCADAAIGAPGEGNVAAGRGGGIYFTGAECRPIFGTEVAPVVSVVDGIAGGDGGGVYVHTSVRRVLVTEDALTLQNLSVGGCQGANGGGIAIGSAAEPVIQRATLSACVALGDGGGLAVLGAAVGPARVRIEDVRVTGSTALRGGGVFLAVPNLEVFPSMLGTAHLSGIFIDGCSADEGGGLYATSPGGLGQDLVVTNLVVVGNSATVAGGGVFIDGFEQGVRAVVLRHLTVAGNDAPNGTGAGVRVEAADASIRNSIVVDQLNGEGVQHVGAGATTSDFNDVIGNAGGDYDGLVAGGNDIASPPQFIDPEALYYWLAETSPCIGVAGDAGDGVTHIPPTDILGNARPFPVSGENDMGAYEAQVESALTQIEDVEPLSSTRLRVYFSNGMSNDAALSSPASYSLLESAPAVPLGVLDVEVPLDAVNPEYVDLWVNEMTQGGAYTLTPQALRDRFDQPLLEVPTPFIGLGEAPWVVTAYATNSTTVSVVFSEAMDSTGLTTAGNYTSPGFSVVSVTQVASNEVELTTSAMTSGASYTLSVSTTLLDLAQNTLDPNRATATFGGYTGRIPPISKQAADANGRARLAVAEGVVDWRYLDITGTSFWAPDRLYTGFGADGRYYQAGVVDDGHSRATWADEAEAPDNPKDRGPGRAFPARSFLVLGRRELVILSADDLTVWMRFRLGEGGLKRALGGETDLLRSVAFDSGVLVVGTSNGVRLFCFRGLGEDERDAAAMVRQDGYFLPRETEVPTRILGLRDRNTPDYYVDIATEDDVYLLSDDVSDVAAARVSGHTYLVVAQRPGDLGGGLTVLRIRNTDAASPPPYSGEPDYTRVLQTTASDLEAVAIHREGWLFFTAGTPRRVHISQTAWTAAGDLDPDSTGLPSRISRVNQIAVWGDRLLIATDVGVYLVEVGAIGGFSTSPTHLYGGPGSGAQNELLGPEVGAEGDYEVFSIAVDPESGLILVAQPGGILEIDSAIHRVVARTEFPTLPHLNPSTVGGFRNSRLDPTENLR